MKVSKNKWRGELITDLRELKELSLQRKSVVVERGRFFRYVRPAAFVLAWQLNMVLNSRIYHTLDKDPNETKDN